MILDSEFPSIIPLAPPTCPSWSSAGPFPGFGKRARARARPLLGEARGAARPPPSSALVEQRTEAPASPVQPFKPAWRRFPALVWTLRTGPDRAGSSSSSQVGPGPLRVLQCLQPVCFTGLYLSLFPPVVVYLLLLLLTLTSFHP